MKEKIKLGQTVFVKGISRPGDMPADNTTELIETTVSKVGRKYFEVERLKNHVSFEIETLEEKHFGGGYGRNWKVYLTKQNYEEDLERAELGRKIRDYVNKSNMRFPQLTLDDLRVISGIISK